MTYFCECCDVELGSEIINVIGNHTVCDDNDCIRTADWYVNNVDNNPKLAEKPTMQDVHLSK